MSEKDNYVVHASKIAKGIEVQENNKSITVEGILEHSRRSKRIEFDRETDPCR